MVILWPDIESGTDLVTSNLDGFKRPSNFNSRWLWHHLDSILDGYGWPNIESSNETARA
jgi:hypothetical protein